MRYCLIIFFPFAFVISACSQGDTPTKLPNNLFIGVETGFTAAFWKDPTTGERTNNLGFRVVPKLAVGIGKTLYVGGHYEHEFTNKTYLPKVYGYGLFIRFYPIHWSSKINEHLKSQQIKIFPSLELIYNRANTFYDQGIFVDERSNKYNRLSLGGGIDVKPFKYNFCVNLGYRLLIFLDGPQQKLLPAPKLEFAYFF